MVNGTSTGSSGNEGSAGLDTTPYTFQLIEQSDFYVRQSVLHPVVIGSIAIIVTFLYMRISSNRAVAPLSVFDVIINVALGSTLAGIVNGNSLVRGLLGLITLAVFQLMASTIGSRKTILAQLFTKKSLIVAFRGRSLPGVMKKHKISEADLYQALRCEKVWDIREVEACIIEPTGAFAVYLRANYPSYPPDVLLAVPGYQALCDKEEEDKERGAGEGGRVDKGSDDEEKRTGGEIGGRRQSSAGNEDEGEKGCKRCSSRDNVAMVHRKDQSDAKSVHSQSSIANRAA